MPPPSNRVHEAESSSSASAPKRIRGSAANWGRAGFVADPVMNSHCFTWQNASLKELDEETDDILGESQLLWNQNPYHPWVRSRCGEQR